MKFYANQICTAALLVVLAAVSIPMANAQNDNSTPPSQDNGAAPAQQDNGAPATTQGDNGASAQQDTGAAPAATAPPELNVENPPLSGLDEPQAEPAYGGRSYLVPGVQLSESADSNPSGTTNSQNSVTEISRILGGLDLQKIWRQAQLGLDYIGGDIFYTGPRFSSAGRNYQVHTLAADQRILWRTGQLAFRDSFNYLPQGTFGFNSFGGAGGFSGALGGGLTGVGAGSGVGGGLTGGSGSGVVPGGTIGSIGFQPRISNLSTVDLVEQLSPRSSVTLAGTYDFTHFLNTSQSSLNVINSQLVSGQVGFNRLLSRKDQIAVLYAFQEIHFPTSGSGTVQAHVWNALYGHRITGRLNLTLAGGPQLVTLKTSVGSTSTISGNGRALLHYMVTARTNVQIQYQHYVTPGSGFFAGANSDVARVSLSRVFGRHWTAMTDGGYSHNTSLQKNLTSGLSSNTYQFWYAGGSLRRQIGQHFGAFASYQFNDFTSGQCTTTPSTTPCGQTIPQHVGMIGLDWHPRPIRLD